jgi:hypothetical protein
MEPEGPCLDFFVYLMTLREVLALVPPLAAFLYQSDNRLVKRKISASLWNRTTAFQTIFSHFISWAMLPYPRILTEAKERAILASPALLLLRPGHFEMFRTWQYLFSFSVVYICHVYTRTWGLCDKMLNRPRWRESGKKAMRCSCTSTGSAPLTLADSVIWFKICCLLITDIRGSIIQQNTGKKME